MKRTMKDRGLLIVVSGPSGAGKGTVMRYVFEKCPNMRYSVSVTTRAPREGEVDGREYFFRTTEQFIDMLHHDEFLEHQRVYDNYYGTPKKFVEDLLDKGFDVLLEIDVKGALVVKKNRPETVTVFLCPPDKATLESRLRGRSTETEDQLKVRLAAAVDELKSAEKYDYVVVNQEALVGAEEIASIIRAEKCRTRRKRNKSFLENLIYGGNSNYDDRSTD